MALCTSESAGANSVSTQIWMTSRAAQGLRLNVPGGQWLGYLNGHVLHLNKIFDEPRALAALEEGRRLHASHGNPNKSISLSDS
jgi:hypothetical protein